MFSFFKKNKIETVNKRIVVIVGGGGVLGRALIKEKPENIVIINITKTSNIDNVTEVKSYNLDVLIEPEKTINILFSAGIIPDVLINVAYSKNFRSIANLDKKIFSEEVALNTFIPIYLSRLICDNFWSKSKKEENIARNRKIINISSGAAFSMTGREDLATYGGTKAALNVMTEYLDKYLSDFGVSAHIIAPGSFKNEIILKETVNEIWDLQGADIDKFSLKKIY